VVFREESIAQAELWLRYVYESARISGRYVSLTSLSAEAKRVGIPEGELRQASLNLGAHCIEVDGVYVLCICNQEAAT
jgi:hypothetical protein